MNADELAIKLYLRDHPQSNAVTMETALGLSRKKIAGILGKCKGVTKTSTASGFMDYSLADEHVESSPEDCKPPHDLAAVERPRSLIDELVSLITAPIRTKFETELAHIAPKLIEQAINDVQGRVMRDLGELFRIDSAFEQTRIVGIDLATPGGEVTVIEKRVVTGHAQSAPVVEMPPPGNFVPNDPVSRRTSHDPRHVVVQKASSVGVSTPVADKKRPQKIIVIGLQSAQQELIKREFRNKFDLRLFNADQLVFIRKAINPGDVVLCMAGHISHMHTDVATAEGGQAVMVHGGMTSLRDELTERYELTMSERKAA